MVERSLLSTVALLADMPEKALRHGKRGTVVKMPGRGVYEVELNDDSSQTSASMGPPAEEFWHDCMWSPFVPSNRNLQDSAVPTACAYVSLTLRSRRISPSVPAFPVRFSSRKAS